MPSAQLPTTLGLAPRTSVTLRHLPRLHVSNDSKLHDEIARYEAAKQTTPSDYNPGVRESQTALAERDLNPQTTLSTNCRCMRDIQTAGLISGHGIRTESPTAPDLEQSSPEATARYLCPSRTQHLSTYE